MRLAALILSVALPASASVDEVKQGQRLLAGKRPAEAVRILSHAVESEPGKIIPDAWLALGDAYVELSRPAEALVALDRAIAMWPTSLRAHVLRAKALVLTRQPAKALAEYRNILELSSSGDDVGTLSDVGMALLQAGDTRGAVEALRKAVAASGYNPSALNDLGYALLMDGNATEAEQVLERALQQWPQDTDALTPLGDARAVLGRMEEAVDAYQAAVAAQPRNGRAWFHLGLAWKKMKRPDLAATALEKAKALDPTNDHIARALVEVRAAKP